MWDIIKAAFQGAGLTLALFMILVIVGRGCVAILDAHEPDVPPVVGTYDVHGVYGRPFITRDFRPFIDRYEVIVETEVIIVESISGKDYVTCIYDQRFYKYVINRYEKEDPEFWANTIKLYKALEEECKL